MVNFNTKRTILLVDDDLTVLSVGTMMIQRSGYKVLQATSGIEAIQVFKNYKNDICLVVLDEKLPDEPGSDGPGPHCMDSLSIELSSKSAY